MEFNMTLVRKKNISEIERIEKFYYENKYKFLHTQTTTIYKGVVMVKVFTSSSVLCVNEEDDKREKERRKVQGE